MSSRIEKSRELFINKYQCAQTVLSVFCEELELDEHTALSLACGLGGGFRQREICGAVSGVIIAIGLKCGKISPENNTNRKYTYQKVDEFIAKFNEKHGSIICRELFPEEKRPTAHDDRETELQKYKDSCTCFVEDAVLDNGKYGLLIYSRPSANSFASNG